MTQNTCKNYLLLGFSVDAGSKGTKRKKELRSNNSRVSKLLTYEWYPQREKKFYSFLNVVDFKYELLIYINYLYLFDKFQRNKYIKTKYNENFK